MTGFRVLVLSAVAGCCMLTTSPKAVAQISVQIGEAPQCPYGYYDSSPYGCAPYGYYGSEWFRGGSFIGAGPWFHGRSNFRGHVDNRFHPDYGYRGHNPERGERAERTNRTNRVRNFRGNEMRDGRGHGDGEHDRNHDRDRH
jgi:hypothetical protein